MFELSDTLIDAEGLRQQCLSEEAGGFVCFEGWVRNRNEGRDVTRLEFEASGGLAAREFEKIEKEIFERYQVKHLVCVHRIGVVQLGELAVWIGLTAKHRDGAFQGCRYAIDELKERLPIWKKEFYTDGDSGWINHP